MPLAEKFIGRVVAALAVLTAAGRASAQHLWTVDDNGPADFTTIQAAIDAAADGDVVRVFAGTYAGFQIASKGIAILGDSAAPRLLTTPVSVTSTNSGQTVLVSGFVQSLAFAVANQAPGITISGCAGAVRIQDCSWHGKNSPGGTSPITSGGGSGARLENSSDLMFVATVATGGNGSVTSAGLPYPGSYQTAYGGGHALDVLASSLACWQVSGTAGLPGTAHTDHNFGGTEGGSGALLAGSFLFASDSLLKGGKGGSYSSALQCGQTSGYGTAGDGGAGLRLDSPASTALFQAPNIAVGPPGSTNCEPFYSAGQAVPRVLVHAAGSTLGRVKSPPRTLAAPAFVAGASVVDLTVTGAPGDLVYAIAEQATQFQYDPALHGVWSLSYPPQPAVNPDAVIPSGGSVVFQITLPAVPATQDAEVHFVQLYVVDLNGRTFVSTPRTVVLAH